MFDAFSMFPIPLSQLARHPHALQVHFGKFVNHHLLNTYYFDIHPPFTKFIIVAILKIFSGYEGTSKVKRR